MDALKLNYKSKDQLHPLLSELMGSLNTSMPKDFEGRGKIVQWLITLNQMRAADEVTDGQSRQVSIFEGPVDGRCYLILRPRIINFSTPLGSRRKQELNKGCGLSAGLAGDVEVSYLAGHIARVCVQDAYGI